MQMQIQTFPEQPGKHRTSGRGQAISSSVTKAETDDKRTERYFAVIMCPEFFNTWCSD